MLKPFALLACLVNRHSPDRDHVSWDGRHYCGTCTACGKPIRRKEHRNWRADWLSD